MWLRHLGVGGSGLAEGTCLQVAPLSSLQGNGHERDFMGDRRVYIMDVYNRHIYPGDRFAKRKLPRPSTQGPLSRVLPAYLALWRSLPSSPRPLRGGHRQGD